MKPPGILCRTLIGLLWLPSVYAQANRPADRWMVTLQGQSKADIKPRDPMYVLPQSAYAIRQLSLSAQMQLMDLGKSGIIKINPYLQAANLSLGDLAADRKVFQAGLGVSYSFQSSKQNAWMMQVRAFSNEDEYTLADPVFRYALTGVWVRYTRSQKFPVIITGGALHYTFGAAAFTPVLGGLVRTSKNSILSGLLPLQIRWRYYPKNEQWSWGLQSQITGGFNRFQDKRNLDTTGTIWLMRRSQLTTTAFVSIHRQKAVFTLQAGVSKILGVGFTDENNSANFVNLKAENAVPWLQLKMSVPIQKLSNRKSVYQMEEDINLLGQPDW